MGSIQTNLCMSCFTNMHASIQTALRLYPLSETISYAALLDKVRRLAASFRELGIVSGDVIAYQLQNGWHHCAIDLAAAAIGAIVAPFPPGRGRLDIQSLLRRCDARVIIVEQEYAGVDLCGLIESIRPTSAVSPRSRCRWKRSQTAGIRWIACFKPSRSNTDQFPAVSPDSPVRLLISSGTESEPKWVAYSHNALIGGRGRFLQRIHSEEDAF